MPKNSCFSNDEMDMMTSGFDFIHQQFIKKMEFEKHKSDYFYISKYANYILRPIPSFALIQLSTKKHINMSVKLSKGYPINIQHKKNNFHYELIKDITILPYQIYNIAFTKLNNKARLNINFISNNNQDKSESSCNSIKSIRVFINPEYSNKYKLYHWLLYKSHSVYIYTDQKQYSANISIPCFRKSNICLENSENYLSPYCNLIEYHAFHDRFFCFDIISSEINIFDNISGKFKICIDCDMDNALENTVDNTTLLINCSPFHNLHLTQADPLHFDIEKTNLPVTINKYNLYNKKDIYDIKSVKIYSDNHQLSCFPVGDILPSFYKQKGRIFWHYNQILSELSLNLINLNNVTNISNPFVIEIMLYVISSNQIPENYHNAIIHHENSDFMNIALIHKPTKPASSLIKNINIENINYLTVNRFEMLFDLDYLKKLLQSYYPTHQHRIKNMLDSLKQLTVKTRNQLSILEEPSYQFLIEISLFIDTEDNYLYEILHYCDLIANLFDKLKPINVSTQTTIFNKKKVLKICQI